jgi:hypothetical protein
VTAARHTDGREFDDRLRHLWAEIDWLAEALAGQVEVEDDEHWVREHGEVSVLFIQAAKPLIAHAIEQALDSEAEVLSEDSRAFLRTVRGWCGMPGPSGRDLEGAAHVLRNIALTLASEGRLEEEVPA